MKRIELDYQKKTKIGFLQEPLDASYRSDRRKVKIGFYSKKLDWKNRIKSRELLLLLSLLKVCSHSEKRIQKQVVVFCWKMLFVRIKSEIADVNKKKNNEKNERNKKTKERNSRERKKWLESRGNECWAGREPQMLRALIWGMSHFSIKEKENKNRTM